MKIKSAIILTLAAMLSFSNAYAWNDSTGTRSKKESTSVDANSSVMYGNYGTAIKPIKVNSSGNVITTGGGTAGTPDTSVVTVQGITNGTPVPVTAVPSLGTRVTHRATITDTNDTYTYGSGDTERISLAGYKYAIVEIKISGANASWDITPEFGDATASTYFKSTTRTVTRNERFVIEVDGETLFMIRCDNKQGTTPTITVYVTPFN